jgi:hypothetical protein
MADSMLDRGVPREDIEGSKICSIGSVFGDRNCRMGRIPCNFIPCM